MSPKRPPPTSTPLPEGRSPPLIGVGSELGDYLLTSRICAGGMGEIFAAVHLRLGRDVAIKLPRRHSRCGELFDERLRQEARCLAQVGHPNVVQVFDLQRARQGFHFMVLELLGGRALDAVLQRVGPLPLSLALELARQIAEGVDAVHRAGIVGIDVKPENVMVVDGPLIGASRDAAVWAKLIDLGTARICRGAGTAGDAPLGIGTPAYLAPELVRGEIATVATDLYALGMLLQEAVTGRHPFLRGTAAQVMENHLFETPPLLSEQRDDLRPGSALEQLVADTLAKDPLRRPPSAAAFLERLEVATEQWVLRHAPRYGKTRPLRPLSAPPPASPVPPERQTQRLPERATLTPPELRALDRAGRHA